MLKKFNIIDKICFSIILLCVIILAMFFVFYPLCYPKTNIEVAENDGKIINYETMKLSVNRASLDELISIKGIGEATALKIIDFRNKKGSIKTIDELIEIDGIGEKKLNEMKKYLTIE